MAPIGSKHRSTLTYGDATEEKSTMSINNGAITALSIAGFLTQFGAFQTATDAITLGNRMAQSWIGDDTVVSNSFPTNPAAQREAKLLVTYIDAVTENPHKLTIPTIDFSKLNFVPGGGDAVLFEGAGANADIVAWVTAFEALAKSPDDDTHAVTVTKMNFVGRNT